MSEYRQKLIDRVTKMFGLEHSNTIAFIYACEHTEDNELNDTSLRGIVEVWEGTDWSEKE